MKACRRSMRDGLGAATAWAEGVSFGLGITGGSTVCIVLTMPHLEASGEPTHWLIARMPGRVVSLPCPR